MLNIIQICSIYRNSSEMKKVAVFLDHSVFVACVLILTILINTD